MRAISKKSATNATARQSAATRVPFGQSRHAGSFIAHLDHNRRALQTSIPARHRGVPLAAHARRARSLHRPAPRTTPATAQTPALAVSYPRHLLQLTVVLRLGRPAKTCL